MPTFPKYESYKNSGVAWLEDIPEHWEVLPGRAYLKPKKVKNTGNKVDTVLSLSYGKIVIKPEEKLHGLVPESFETYQIVEPGDIIVRATDLQNDHTSLRIGLVEDRGIITSAYLCLHPTEMMNSRFAYYLLHSYDLLKVYYGMGSGLRQNLDYTDFKYLPLTVPSLEEQKRIVEFLDRTTTEIDRAISQKQRLIELLQEQKAILINQAVTKGLNPNVPMRDSGIEWLGEIPEHWEIRQLSQLLKYGPKNGISPPVDSHSSGALSFSISAVKNGKIILDNSVFKRVSRSHQECTEYTLDAGDILIVRGNGSVELVGSCGLVEKIPDEPCIYPDTLMCIRPNEQEINSFFLVQMLGNHTVRTQIKMKAKTSTGLYKVNNQDIRSLKMILPPLQEQIEISKHVNSILENSSDAELKTQQQINVLQEFRQVAIASAVTGKIKV